MRRALHVHPLSTYLVLQALTAILALAYAGVMTRDTTSWSHWFWMWAMLAVVGLIWTQLVWGPCWEAGADYGLSSGVRIALMAISGGALLLPFLALNFFFGSTWLFVAMYLTPYGLVNGLLGGIVLALRDRETIGAARDY